MSWSLALVIIVATCVIAGAIEGIVETITRAKTSTENTKQKNKDKLTTEEKNKIITTDYDILAQLEHYIEVGYMFTDLINKQDLLEWIKEKRKKV